jgi:hypothetical protein
MQARVFDFFMAGIAALDERQTQEEPETSGGIRNRSHMRHTGRYCRCGRYRGRNVESIAF